MELSPQSVFATASRHMTASEKNPETAKSLRSQCQHSALAARAWKMHNPGQDFVCDGSCRLSFRIDYAPAVE